MQTYFSGYMMIDPGVAHQRGVEYADTVKRTLNENGLRDKLENELPKDVCLTLKTRSESVEGLLSYTSYLTDRIEIKRGDLSLATVYQNPPEYKGKVRKKQIQDAEPLATFLERAIEKAKAMVEFTKPL